MIFLKQAKMYPHKVAKFTDFDTVVVVVRQRGMVQVKTFLIPGLDDKGNQESTYID